MHIWECGEAVDAKQVRFMIKIHGGCKQQMSNDIQLCFIQGTQRPLASPDNARTVTYIHIPRND